MKIKKKKKDILAPQTKTEMKDLSKPKKKKEINNLIVLRFVQSKAKKKKKITYKL